MSTPTRLAAFASLARHLLEPEDVERMVMPAIADAAFESGERPRLRELASLASQLTRIFVIATWLRVSSRAKASSWWPLFAATVAGVAGSVGLQHTERGSLSHAQLVFVLIGLIASTVVVLAPTRFARTLGMVSIVLAAAALASVPWAGVAYHGVHRWLRLGPVAVHASVLVLPVFAVLVARGADRWPRPATTGLVVLVIALLLAQPDSPSAMVYAITAAAASWRSQARAWVLPASIAGATAALLLHSPLPPVTHVEGAHRLLAAEGPVWLAAGAGALAVVLLIAARSWRALVRRADPSARVYERQTAGATAGLVAMLTVPQLLGEGGLPLISFGGSAVFAAYVLTAIVMRSSRAGHGTVTFTAA